MRLIIFEFITEIGNSFPSSVSKFRTSVTRIRIVNRDSTFFFFAIIQCMKVSTDLYFFSRTTWFTETGKLLSSQCLYAFRSIRNVTGSSGLIVVDVRELFSDLWLVRLHVFSVLWLLLAFSGGLGGGTSTIVVVFGGMGIEV